MSVYTVAVFLHVVGALGIFAALGLEWAGLRNLRRATTTDQAREWLALFGGLRRIGGPSALILLVTGLYMNATQWGGEQPWIGLGLLGLITMAVLGPTLTGRRVRAVARELSADDGPLSPDLRARLRDPVLLLSARLRTALGLAIVFLMSVKPDGAVALSVMLLSPLLAAAWGLVARSDSTPVSPGLAAGR